MPGAVRYYELGGPEVLHPGEVSLREPGAGGVWLRGPTPPRPLVPAGGPVTAQTR